VGRCSRSSACRRFPRHQGGGYPSDHHG
jgi:hypothetical protein